MPLCRLTVRMLGTGTPEKARIGLNRREREKFGNLEITPEGRGGGRMRGNRTLRGYRSLPLTTLPPDKAAAVEARRAEFTAMDTDPGRAASRAETQTFSESWVNTLSCSHRIFCQA